MKLLPLAAFALAPFLAFAGLEDALPATTFGLVKVESLADSRAKLAAHPVAKSAGADKIKKLFDSALAKARAKDASAEKDIAEVEKFIATLDKQFKGEALFAVVKPAETLPGHSPLDFVVLAKTDADDAAIAEFLKDAKLLQPQSGSGADRDADKADAAKPDSDMKTQADEDDEGDDITPAPVATRPKFKRVLPKLDELKEEFAGTTLHMLTHTEGEQTVNVGGWAIIEKTFVYATAPNVLKDLVEARKSGRKDGFGDSAFFKDSKEALAGRDAWLLINPELIGTTLRANLVAEQEKAQKEGRPFGFGALNPLAVLDALAIDNLTRLRLALSLNPADTRVETSLAWKEQKGLVKLLRYTADAAPESGLAPADAIAVDASRIDLSAALAGLESMIRDAFPMAAPMLDLQLDRLKNQEGLDLRSGLLANLGDSLVVVTGAAVDSGDDTSPDALANAIPQVWVVSLKDEAKLTSLIDTAMGKIASAQTGGDGAKSLFDEREIQGVKIRDFKQTNPGSPRIAYAIHKNRLLISKGDPALLNKVIGQLLSPKPGLDASPAHKAALAKLPEGGAGISHSDLGGLAGIYSSILTKVLAMKGGDAELDIKPGDLPKSADLPFVVVGKAYAKPTSIESVAVIVPKSTDEETK